MWVGNTLNFCGTVLQYPTQNLRESTLRSRWSRRSLCWVFTSLLWSSLSLGPGEDPNPTATVVGCLVGTYCKVSVSVEVEEVDPICKMCQSCLLFTSSMVQLLAMRITAYMTECMLPNDYTFIDINHMSETQTTCFSNRFKGNSISHVFGKVDMNVITLTSALWT